MERLSDPDEVLVLKPQKEDLFAGAKYASLSLPWTFNRMMLNTGPSGQKFRALNIAKGIVGQEVLGRELSKRGLKTLVQRKSYRDDDLFDFRLQIGEKELKLDLKTMNYFSNYNDVCRLPFSKDLLLSNASYPGPDWRFFFPMLVPHTQIGQDKDAYCFAITSSIDFRNDNERNRIDHILSAFPYGKMMPFLSSQKLCLYRENVGKGFFITFKWDPSPFDTDELLLHIVGEWDGKTCEKKIIIKKGKTEELGPFSCVSSFVFETESYRNWISDLGVLSIWVSANEYVETVLNSSRRNINIVPDDIMTFGKKDFCNLFLPNDYTIYYIGWITKDEFLDKCRNHPSWVWPLDRVDKYKNQSWSQITENDKRMIERTGFDDCISKNPPRLNAGWMKTTGRGGGACCYVYPNIGRGGGVKETNLYVLPEDLNIVENLGCNRG